MSASPSEAIPLTVTAADEATEIFLMDAGLTEHDSFAFLRSEAMRQRVKIHDVARMVIEQGLRPESVAADQPGGGQPATS